MVEHAATSGRPTSSSSAPARPARPPPTTSPRPGVDVLLLEKTAFPREKVCGDGLTPRAVTQLVADGHRPRRARAGSATTACASSAAATGSRCPGPTWPSTPTTAWSAPGWTSTRSWPATRRRPAPGCTSRPPSPARSLDERPAGSSASPPSRSTTTAARSATRSTYRAPLVVAADGNSTRLSLAMGLQKRDDRPMGVAVRTYYTSPRHDDDWLESWLELWDGEPGDEQPAARATAGSSASATAPATSASASSTPRRRSSNVDYKDLLQALARPHARGVGLPRREPDRRRSAARRCRWASTASRTTTDGMLLVGDAGGMVNPFNGEGIAYAMESGEMAADVIAQALSRTTADAAASARCRATRRALDERYGGYYTLGRVFVKAIGQPAGDEARHPARPAAADADALHAQAARQPHRPTRRRRDGPASSTACPRSPRRHDDGGPRMSRRP